MLLSLAKDIKFNCIIGFYYSSDSNFYSSFKNSSENGTETATWTIGNRVTSAVAEFRADLFIDSLIWYMYITVDTVHYKQDVPSC